MLKEMCRLVIILLVTHSRYPKAFVGASVALVLIAVVFLSTAGTRGKTPPQ